MEQKSKLELIIGPMFSGKCLEENTLINTFSGKTKKIKDIDVGEYIVNHKGEPVKVIKKYKGQSNLYEFIFSNNINNFSCTPNHKLVIFNKLYYYSKFTEKRGIVYFFDKNYKLNSFPCLYKYVHNKIQDLKNKNEILENDTLITITAEEYMNHNRIYSKITYFKKYPINTSYKQRKYSIEKYNFFKDIPEDILNNNIKIKKDYLKQMIIKNKTKWKYCNKEKLFYIFHNTTPEFNHKIKKLCNSLNINIDIIFNYIKLYISNNDLFSENLIIENLYLENINKLYNKNYIGLQVENELFCLNSGLLTHNSTFISSIINKYSIINKNILVLSHSLDKGRYSLKYISTHNGETKIPCYFSENIYEFVKNNKELYNKSKMIFIEECQFFKDLDKFIINELETTDKYFILCGLSGDINAKPFDVISNLIPHCDNLHKLNSFCKNCNDGTLGIYTKLICKNKQIEKKNNYICIGSDEKYISVCRKHYY